MKRILLLLTAVILCGTLTMNGQARKTANRPSAKARTTSVAKAKPKAKAATPATPASDLPLFWALRKRLNKVISTELSRFSYFLQANYRQNSGQRIFPVGWDDVGV